MPGRLARANGTGLSPGLGLEQGRSERLAPMYAPALSPLRWPESLTACLCEQLTAAVSDCFDTSCVGLKTPVDLNRVQSLAHACGTAARSCSSLQVDRATTQIEQATREWHDAAARRNAVLAENVPAHNMGALESEDSEIAEAQELPDHSHVFALAFLHAFRLAARNNP